MRKKISLETILAKKKGVSYQEQYEYVLNLIHSGEIAPIKSSDLNGKSPALYLMYWANVEEEDYSELKNELLYHTHHMISTAYYLKHIAVYQKERQHVRRLNRFLMENNAHLSVCVSINQRSYEIWSDEKFLSEKSGPTILTHCGLAMENLNVFNTSAPFPYYKVDEGVPQTLLIVENSDPFFTMRKHLMEGHKHLFGREIKTLIYGAGNGGPKEFTDFELSGEPYMCHAQNEFLYFGDLDYAGLRIYEKTAGSYHWPGGLHPFKEAYNKMLEKSRSMELRKSEKNQSSYEGNIFFSEFNQDEAEKMKKILEDGYYIPQEILTQEDF